MFFWPNLRNIDVSLLLRQWSLMILWRDIFETLKNSKANFYLCWFFVLSSESLMFQCWTIDESLMSLRRNIDVTAKISLQTVMITNVFLNLISETSLFSCCFVDDSLMIIWRDIFEALINSMESFFIFIVFVVLTSESFMFQWWFIDESLTIFRKH